LPKLCGLLFRLLPNFLNCLGVAFCVSEYGAVAFQRFLIGGMLRE